ncbi:TRAP transporter substrate-binding protein [Geosporobacter ferrireducens]|uniref:TRAP transporter substrate-binding protein n=1 Tax=Geosporobacter ferrireducens TaxID=1424294 RepID=UPI000ABB46A8|nr:TRAP transporter substrate-binding protein [Geosporobacter ferrireducens]
MKLKKLSSLLLAGVLSIGALAGCATPAKDQGTAQDQPKEQKAIVLRMADVHSEDYPTVRANKKFAEIVEQETNGRIKIEVYPSGQLGDEKATLEQVQFGAIDFIRTSIAPLAEFNKDLEVLMLPYLYDDRDHMFKVLDSELGDSFLNGLKDNNMVGLSWYDGGARNFYNSKKEIRSPQDLKGLKIRVQESKLMMDLVKSLGASPTPMAFGEVYSAIQTGVIDGAENNYPSYLSTSHLEVAKYYTLDEHTRVPEMVLASKATIDKLSAEDQAIIMEAAKQAAEFERDEWFKEEQKSEAAAIEKGSIITKLTAEEKKAFQDAVKSIYDQYADRKDIIEQILNTK